MKETFENTIQVGTIFTPPKIKNGSKIRIGNERALAVIVDKHFNRFQKKMIKWFFGFEIADYSEEGE